MSKELAQAKKQIEVLEQKLVELVKKQAEATTEPKLAAVVPVVEHPKK